MKKIHLDLDAPVGRVWLTVNPQAKSIILRIHPDCSIHVTANPRIRPDAVAQYVKSRSRWIEEQRERICHWEEHHRQLPTSDRRFDDLAAARVFLKNRLRFWADRYNIKIGRITIRSQKTRWGSCSSLRNINLNIKLVRLPDELMDYVLLHELLHIPHPNHGQHFWAHLKQIYPQAEECRERLKSYCIEWLSVKDALG